MSSHQNKRNIIVPTTIVGGFVLVVSLMLKQQVPETAAQIDPPPKEELNDQASVERLSPETGEGFEKFREQLRVDPKDRNSFRNKRWRDNFPWQPQTDPNLKITQELLDSRFHEPEIANHGFLKGFFQNEIRFSPQFESLYHLLEEYDRADNPVEVGKIFEILWLYHNAVEAEKNPNENPPERDPESFYDPHNLFSVAGFSEAIATELRSPRSFPDKEPFSKEEAEAIRDRIIREISGVKTMPRPLFVYRGEFENELQAGDTPLTPYPGWQEAYDRWEVEHNARIDRAIAEGKLDPSIVGRRPASPIQPAGIGPNRELLDQNGNPILAKGDNPSIGGLVTPDGRQLPLKVDEENRIIIPRPRDFE